MIPIPKRWYQMPKHNHVLPRSPQRPLQLQVLLQVSIGAFSARCAVMTVVLLQRYKVPGSIGSGICSSQFDVGLGDGHQLPSVGWNNQA